MIQAWQSFVSMLAAIIIALSGGAQPDATADLAGTQWVDEDGYIFRFTEDGDRFHNWWLMIIYQKLDDGHFHQTAINQDGLIAYIGYPLISFEQDGGILTMTISYENRDSYIQHYHALTDEASLSGTRWLHEDGRVYSFSEDAILFTSKNDDTILCMAYQMGIYQDCTFHTQYGFYRANTSDETNFAVVDGILLQTITAQDGTVTQTRYTPAP